MIKQQFMLAYKCVQSSAQVSSNNSNKSRRSRGSTGNNNSAAVVPLV